MITVVGEALIDLVVGHDGRIDAQPGGGPFNTARTLGRLGRSPAFLGRLSQDGFGDHLRDRRIVVDHQDSHWARREPVSGPVTPSSRACLAALAFGTHPFMF